MEALTSTFKPEFLNRVDDIIIFRSLTLADIEQIIEIQLRLIQKRLEDRKIRLVLTKEAKNYLADIGYSPTYGARPLKRALQKQLLDVLALRILDGTVREGNKVTVDFIAGKGLTFSVEQAEA